MRKFRSFLWSMFVLVVAFVSTTSGATYTVTMTAQNKFSPAVTNILVGDTVVWMNAGFVQHTVTPTNNNEAFCGTTLLDRCEYTFTQPGSFAYYCIPHTHPPFQFMTGLVVVASPPNGAPTVAITSPQDGASFSAPASFQVTANATDADGNVVSVEFFLNNQSVAITQPPNFSTNINSLTAGSYTLTAMATDNSGATGLAAPVSITVTQANIVLPKYPLTISVSPANSGTVTAQPPQPEGGYEFNTIVTLTAAANTGFAFQNWSGDVTGTENPATIIMNGPRSFTANFTPVVAPTRTLSVNTNPADGGAVQVAPAPNGPNETYLDGTIVTITAQPAFGFSFSNWSGSAAAATNPLVLTMDADKTITANFLSTPVTSYALTLITNPVGAGTINVSPLPNAPGGTYVAGTLVTITATALTTNAFTNWTGDVIAASNHVTITMDGNKTAIANFVPVVPPRFHLAISISPTNGGHVLVTPSVDTNATYAVNTAVALAAVPEHGFRFSQWSGATSSTNNPIVLTINADTAITAQFEPLNALDFAALAGSYSGLALNENRADHAASGTLNLRVAKTGSYRGTALLGGARQPVAGQFDRFGYAPLVFRRGTLSGSLQVDPGAARMTGILTDGQKSPALLLYRVGVVSNAAEFAGTYAITFGTNGPVNSDGAATLVIRENGSVRIRGQLADGAKFSEHTTLTPDARVPLTAMLYGKAGSLLGWLNLTTNFTVEGTALWSRPADSRSRDFPEGFAIQVPVIGARQ